MKRAIAKKHHERDANSYGGRGAALSEESIGPLGVLFSLVLIAISVAILDYGVLPPPFALNSIATADVRARTDFSYNDPDELNTLRIDAGERAPNVYVEDSNWVDTSLHELGELTAIVDVASSAADARDRASRFPAAAQLVEELYKFKEQNGAERKGFLSSTLLVYIRSKLQTLADEGVLTEEHLKDERNKRGAREIIRLGAAHLQAAPAGRRTNEPRPRVKVADLRDTRGARDVLSNAPFLNLYPEHLKFQLRNYFVSICKLDANLQLNEQECAIEKAKACDAVGSGEILVHRNDVILAKDQAITKLVLEKMHEEYRAYKAALSLSVRIRHVTGLATLAFGVLMCFLFAASRLQESVFKRRQALVMLGILCMATLLVTRLLLLSGLSAALTPLVFVAMVAALAFSQAVTLLALFGLTVLIVFAGIFWEAAPGQTAVPALPIAMLVGGIAAAMPARNLQKRLDLLYYGAVGGIVQCVLVAGLSLLGTGIVGVPSLFDVAIAGVNGVLCGLLVLGSLPLIESLFGILTNIRLFELSDMNQPALRRLQLEAPGTFAHTLQVRFLAEPASDAIGANTRLISAGVLYHDLGKTLKPEYFVENQLDAESLHQRLRPSVSALLITAHVKDGVELAREYGLPQQIIDFIPEHHGTTLVSYFYHSARKNAEAQGASSDSGGRAAVQESFFRYPGPRPRSRETGIVMLADTVEAASRTLTSPSAARLQAFVHELIMEKMLDGQLDECELTFADLNAIEDSFVRILVTRFHSRIRYPGQQPDESKPPEHSGKTTVVEPQAPAGPETPKPAPSPAVVPPAQPAVARRQALTETRFLARPESGKAE